MRTNMFENEIEVSGGFEIVLLDRDNKGVPTGKKIRFRSDSASKISDFYDKHVSLQAAKQGRNKKKNKVKKNND